MFLKNLFLGKQSDESSELHKYDRITFHININQNIPEISEQAKTIQQDEHQLASNHPLYYEVFKKEQKQEETQEYITKEDDDTLMGVALKLNVSVELLKSINGFSGDQLFPKMVTYGLIQKIKIPKTADITLLDDKKPQQFHGRPKISELFLREHESTGTSKYELYYCAGAVGNIRGTLNLNPNYIMFNPHVENEENKASFTMEKLLKFNAIIEIQDIKEVLPIDIPTMSEEAENPDTAYIVQLLLFKIGNKKIEEKYKQRLKQLKLDHKAIASISFKMIGFDQQAKQMQAEIVNKIDSMIKSVEPEKHNEQGLTNIPFFDILYHNIATKKQSINSNASEQKEQKHRKTSLINIRQTSESMLPHQAFIEIATYFPLLYQLHNWGLVYSCMQNGTSFNTMMRMCNGKDPLLLVIKEYKGNIIGAYLADPLEMGKSGRGEMFVWRYQVETKKVDVYEWTGQSEFFCFADSDGLGIGMGTKYGIFINSTLEKGHSGETKTFGNPQLSVKEDFQIENLEVWGLDQNE